MILHIDKIGDNRSFNNVIALCCDDVKYYARRTEWPNDEVFMQLKHNDEDDEYLQRIFLIDNNCDVHNIEVGWETCIGINDALANDWEIWLATIG